MQVFFNVKRIKCIAFKNEIWFLQIKLIVCIINVTTVQMDFKKYYLLKRFQRV